MVEGNEVKDEQIKDSGVEVDSKGKDEPTIRGEPEVFSLGLHQL